METVRTLSATADGRVAWDIASVDVLVKVGIHTSLVRAGLDVCVRVVTQAVYDEPALFRGSSDLFRR